MADVFISYHEETSGNLASRIAYVLNDHDISCWYAKRDLPVGGDFADYIPSQIEKCKVFLLIADAEAMQSKHVENELGLAFSRFNKKRDITIVPYHTDDCAFSSWMRYYLVHIQIKKFPQNFREMIDQVAAALGKNTEFTFKHQSKINKNIEKAIISVYDSGKCGKRVEWDSYSNKVLFIRGSGKMANERVISFFKNIPDNTNNIVIDQGITKIGRKSFVDYLELTRVVIPDSIIIIGSSAFQGCGKLKNVDIPNSVIDIGWFTFRNCTSLTSIKIPETITHIKPGTFSECTRLATVTFPDSLSNIWPFAFYHCPRLKRVCVPKNARIWPFAFDRNTVIERK